MINVVYIVTHIIKTFENFAFPLRVSPQTCNGAMSKKRRNIKHYFTNITDKYLLL